MDELTDLKFNCTRRHFLSSSSLGLGAFGVVWIAQYVLLDRVLFNLRRPAVADQRM